MGAYCRVSRVKRLVAARARHAVGAVIAPMVMGAISRRRFQMVQRAYASVRAVGGFGGHGHRYGHGG